MRKVIVLLATLAAASVYAQQQAKPTVPVVNPAAPVVKPSPRALRAVKAPANLALALPAIESVQRSGASPGPAADDVLISGEAIRVRGRHFGLPADGYRLALELGGKTMPLLVNPNVPWTSDTIGAYVPGQRAVRDAGLDVETQSDYRVVLLDAQGRAVARKTVALRFVGNRLTDDFDGDGFVIQSSDGRWGGDCDDFDGLRNPSGIEVCDAAGKDEDCDPLTYGVRDADGDHFHDARCFNLDEAGNRTSGGNDCDDTQVTANPIRPENCPVAR